MITRHCLQLGLLVIVNISGKYFLPCLTWLLLLIAVAPTVSSQRPAGPTQTLQPEAEQLLALANQARAAAGARPLEWDGSLAIAARKHSQRMAAEGPIAHRYPGELDVSERAGQAGARFSLIEENVAIGPTPLAIQEEWMHSSGHRMNLLNPEVDRVGIAVVASRGVLYATADYARGVQNLSASEVEYRVAALLRPSGLAILGNPGVARDACAMDSGVPRGSSLPGFILRWQDSELSQLPQALTERLATGKYRQAAIGSCSPSGVEGTFTAYRVAVLLY
jgi:Cysteine-rich secretory protein family